MEESSRTVKKDMRCKWQWVFKLSDVHSDVHRNIIRIVKTNRCTSVWNLFVLEWRSFRPSSGVQDCTYSNRHLSNRYCCLLTGGYEMELLREGTAVPSRSSSISYPPVSRQQYLFDKCLLLYVQSWTPDDGRKDRLKHADRHSKINKFDTLVHLVGFTIGLILNYRCLGSDTV